MKLAIANFNGLTPATTPCEDKTKFSIFPNIIDYLAKIFNIHYPPTLLFVFSTIFLLYINFRNSKKIAINNDKIVELGQRLTILDEKINSRVVDKNEKK